MTSLRLPKAAASIAMVALLCSVLVQPVYADLNTSSAGTWQLDSSTNMRQIPAAPSVDDSTGAPTSGFPATPGCSTKEGTSVFKSLTNTAGFSLAQKVAVHVNTLQMPTSISSCLQSLLKDYDTITNVFTSGFSFSAIIHSAFMSSFNKEITKLENQACQEVNKAANGIVGDLKKIEYSKLLAGGILISANPGGSDGGSSFPATMTDPVLNNNDPDCSGNINANNDCYECPSGTVMNGSGSNAVCYSCPSGSSLQSGTCYSNSNSGSITP